jgi:hypothetical protein
MAEAISSGAGSQGKFKRVTSLLSKRDGIVIGWILSIKIVLFLFGAVTYQILEILCFIGCQPILERNSHGVVIVVPCLLRQPVCLGILGVLSRIKS